MIDVGDDRHIAELVASRHFVFLSILAACSALSGPLENRSAYIADMAPRLSRLERMTNLVLALLETERPASLREIGAAVAGYPPEHGALRQAFERDKRALREAGIPIRTEQIEGEDQAGYRIVPDEYYLPDLNLEPDESEALAFALAGVRLEGGTIGDVAAKLAAPGLPRLAPIAVLPSVPGLGLLQQALRERAQVTFRYHERERVVSGYGLTFKEGSWYFVGLDHTVGATGALRTFRADRIVGTPSLGAPGTYEVPADFSARDQLSISPFGGAQDSTIEVTISVAARSAAAVIGVVGAAAVRERLAGGSVVVAFKVADEDAICSYLLGLGEDVEVLAPPALRERVVTELRARVRGGLTSARR
jgi:predicted DNA-binding transcriptional regulator YafY